LCLLQGVLRILIAYAEYSFPILLFNFVFPGLGCDTAAVVSILAHRDATQRALIQQEYRTMYSDDLLKRLSSELHGKLEVAILYVLM
jgi:hypothetical protein